MQLIDILIIGWLVNVGVILFIAFFGLIVITLFATIGKPIDLVNLTMVTNRYRRIKNLVPEKEKKKIKYETIIRFFIPFSGILELTLFLKDLHSVNYSILLLIEKNSNDIIEKYYI